MPHRPPLLRWAVLPLLGLLLSPALGAQVQQAGRAPAASGQPAAPSVRGLRVSGGWVSATPPGMGEAAAYLTLHNSGQRPVTLTGASSAQAGGAMLMLTGKDAAGRTTMRAVPRLTVPPGGAAVFAPGQAHIMLMDPQPLRPGDTVQLTLHFSDGRALTVPLTVRPL